MIPIRYREKESTAQHWGLVKNHSAGGGMGGADPAADVRSANFFQNMNYCPFPERNGKNVQNFGKVIASLPTLTLALTPQHSKGRAPGKGKRERGQRAGENQVV